MSTIQLLICSILYRKSQKSLAEELAIPRNTLNRIIQEGKEEALHKIEPDIWSETMHKYRMPDGFSPQSFIQINRPWNCQYSIEEIMDMLRETFTGKDLEIVFRMDEIRKYVEMGTEYDDGEIMLYDRYFTNAKTKLDEFLAFMGKNGTVPLKHRYWVRHNRETIAILETASGCGFKRNPAVLRSGIELVFDLKKEIDAMDTCQKSSELKRSLEFLLITSATQTAEILVVGEYPELVSDLTNIIASTFGKWPSDSFKHLMIKAAWAHNQQTMIDLLKEKVFDANGVPIDTEEQLIQRKEYILNTLDQ